MPVLKDRMRTAALANTGLTALIGTNWYDTQLPQTATFPAIVAQIITGPRQYSYTQRMAGYYTRVQFTVWGGQFSAGAESRDSVTAALLAFLDVQPFDGITARIQNPNFVVGDHDSVFAQTEGPLFQRIIDAMIFNNESL